MRQTGGKTSRATKAGSAARQQRERRPVGIQARMHDFKREQILEVAAQLFYEHGYRATTVDDIADALSVTKPFIYYHFRNKEDILKQLYDRILAVSLKFFDGIDVESGAPTDVLRQLVRRYVIGAINSRYSGGIFWRGEKDLPDLDKARGRDFRQKFEAPFRTVLQRGVASGEFSLPDLSVVMLCIEGMINWLYVWYRPGGVLTPEELAEQMSELVAKMAAPVPS